MAKAKGGFKPEDLKKYYFWIVLPILVLLVFVFTFLAKGKLTKAYNEKTEALTAAKSEVDTIAGNKKHPNDTTIKAIKAETGVLADNVFAAWQLMYNDQKIRNRWPRQLSREFLDLVENQLKFRDPIGVGKPYLLEDYGFFIANHLPDLLKEINRRRCQVRCYKLLKKNEMQSIGFNSDDERFWPVYVARDADGNEYYYIGIHSTPDDESSALSQIYLYDVKEDLVSVLDDSALNAELLAKDPEPYWQDVDPWMMDPKSYIIYGVQQNDLSQIVQALTQADSGGGMGGGAMMGGSAAGGAMGGAALGGGMDGPGGARGGSLGGLESGGFSVGAIPGNGYDPALEQIPGTTLEPLLAGVAGNTGMGGMGGMGGSGMGASTMGSGMGSARSSGGMTGGRSGGATSMRSSSGMGGSMAGDSMGGGGGAMVDDPSWSQKVFPGLPPYKERRRIVGNVDWPEPEVYSLPTWDQTAARPQSIEVWYAQETLWVYEALIRVIAETNKDYPDNIAKAPVKCVEQMLIGQNAATEWLTLKTTIGDLTGKSAQSNDLMGMGSADMMMTSSASAGASGGGLSLGSTEEEQALTKIVLGRYIGEEDKPLMPDDKPPFAEFNKMPVCLKLAIDQRHIPDLLTSCANSSMPIDVKHVRVCPDNNVPFVMPIPVSMQSTGDSAMGMMGGGMDMFGGGASGGASGGRNSRGAMDAMGGGMGDNMGGVEIGRTEMGQSEYGVDAIRVEIYGIINIYNEPNEANFATGAAAEESDAQAEAILAHAQGATEDGEARDSARARDARDASDASDVDDTTDSSDSDSNDSDTSGTSDAAATTDSSDEEE
ncbi:MAG: hypothetical protein Q4G03_10940 [Planctomycetia bacterium]|nr:hypothetical protein [Planctomycetia bacterium]